MTKLGPLGEEARLSANQTGLTVGYFRSLDKRKVKCWMSDGEEIDTMISVSTDGAVDVKLNGVPQIIALGTAIEDDGDRVYLEDISVREMAVFPTA